MFGSRLARTGLWGVACATHGNAAATPALPRGADAGLHQSPLANVVPPAQQGSGVVDRNGKGVRFARKHIGSRQATAAR